MYKEQMRDVESRSEEDFESSEEYSGHFDSNVDGMLSSSPSPMQPISNLTKTGTK